MNKQLLLVIACTALTLAVVISVWKWLSPMMFPEPPKYNVDGSLLNMTDTPRTVGATGNETSDDVARAGDLPRNKTKNADASKRRDAENADADDTNEDDDDDEELTPAEQAVKEWDDLAESLMDVDFAADPALPKKIKDAFDALHTDQDREDGMHAMMNLISDGAVQALVPILLDTNYHEDILDIIFNDILNRDDEIKYPILEEIVKNPKHPNFTDAAHILEVTKPDEGPVVIEEVLIEETEL